MEVALCQMPWPCLALWIFFNCFSVRLLANVKFIDRKSVELFYVPEKFLAMDPYTLVVSLDR